MRRRRDDPKHRGNPDRKPKMLRTWVKPRQSDDRTQAEADRLAKEAGPKHRRRDDDDAR